MEIISHGPEFETYETRLAEALDKAISLMPELAVLAVKSMLVSTYNPETVKPQSKRYAAEYKVAFEAACSIATFIARAQIWNTMLLYISIVTRRPGRYIEMAVSF
jgi:hypothetical protein